MIDLKEDVSSHDIVCECETWSESEILQPFNSSIFKCVLSPARRAHVYGRAMGGLLLAYNIKLFSCTIISISHCMIFVKFISFSDHSQFIVGLVYVAPDEDFDKFSDDFNTTINKIFIDFSDFPLFVGGDFNGRVAELNQLDPEIFKFTNSVFNIRRSIDNFLNVRGKEIINLMESNDLILLNGRSLNDCPANFTFLNSLGASTIDLVWCSSGALHAVQDLKVCYLSTLSDHFPIFLQLSFNVNYNTDNSFTKFCFDKEKIFSFATEMAWRDEVADLEKDVDKLNSLFISTIKQVATELQMVKHCYNYNQFIGRKPWWDLECR